MPSKTPKQAKFMRAVAHGWKPSRMKSPPSRAVAREFVEADRKYSGGFAENRYARGGLAFMNEVDSNSERARPLRGFQLGGGTAGIAGMYRRAQEMAEGSQDPEESPYGIEAGTTQQMLDRMGWSGPMGYLKLTSGLRQAGWTPASGSGDGDLANTMWYPPEGTLTGGDGEGGPPPRIIPTDPASYIGISAEEKEALKESPYREQLREHKAKIASTLGSARGGHVNYYQEGGAARSGHPEDTGAKGPNPHDPVKEPAAYKYWESRFHKEPPPPEEVAAAPAPEKVPWYMRIAGYGSEEEAAEVDDVVTGAQTGQAYGGRVRYQLGGLAIAAPAGGVPPWISPTGSGPGYMEEEAQGYQFGGIADRFNPPTAAPAGGPVPQSLAGRAAPDMGGPAPVMQRQMEQAQSAFNPQTGGPRGGVMGGQYRGVPPQRGMISRGAPPGGGSQRGFMGMMNRARQQASAGQNVPGYNRYLEMQRGPGQSTRIPIQPGGTPQGALAQMYGQAQQQQRGARPGFRDPMSGGRGGQYGYEGDPSQPGYDDRSYEDFVAQQRQQGNVSGLPGITDEVLRSRYEGRNANQGAIFTSGPGAPGGGMASPGGGMYTDPNHPFYSPPGSGGSFDMGGNYTPPTSGFLAGHDPTGGRPWGGGRGKPRPGPGMMPPGEEGGGIPGGPRVPPNMRGYLQKQRMMNRPPANVGGGANRVGMQDQQGALSRAMQRGTGRAPPSRRFGRGRAGRGRGFEAQ